MPTGTSAFRGSGLLHGLAGSYPPEVAQSFEDAGNPEDHAADDNLSW